MLRFPRHCRGQQPWRTLAGTGRRAYSIALVGLGHRGYGRHFLSLHGSSSHSIVAACDISPQRISAFSKQHPDIPAYTSLPRLLRSHRPEFALVCVPHESHTDCTAALLQSGIPVLKEKPVAETLRDFSRLQTPFVKIGVAFQKRYEPQFVQLRQRLPEIGEVRSVKATLSFNITDLEATWRASSGVGVTEDAGCHMLDLVTWLFGVPSTLLARGVSSVRVNQEYGGEDISDVVLDWKSINRTATIHLSRVAHEWDEGITVTGTNGTLILDKYTILHFDPQGRLLWRDVFPPVEKQVLRSMAQQFGDWVTGRAPDFITSLDNVRETMAVVQAAKMSLSTGQIQQPGLLLPKMPTARTRRTLIGVPGVAGSMARYHHTARPRVSDLSFLLNTGSRIPAVGLGTRRAQQPGQIREAVRYALRAGYRHIDTAQSSGNEEEIGQGIRDSGLPRERIWVTTKLDNRRHTCVDEAVMSSLHALGLEYLDLFLMHWPVAVDPHDPGRQIPNWNFVKTWKAMNKIPRKYVQNIGVSNFGIPHLQRLLSDPSCRVVPAVNQIELHPYWPSPKLLKYCHDADIHCTAYSCLGSYNSPLLDCQTVADIAEKNRRTKQQVLLMWGLQRGTSVIPKSVHPARIEQNLSLDGWELSPEEMHRLNSLETRSKLCGGDWLPARVFEAE
ncbi:NADP-dependent oxidoreductase domain-containing protein [Aspergillus granulosus]|uniref:D-xylose reductase [NAD(P)H] n=1 Tax=Aspergillus granulosus TaxID=176169 RepID=A0ABR4H017_9EURO